MALFRKAYVNVTEVTDAIMVSHDVKQAVLESGIKEGVVQVLVPTATSAVTLLESDPKIHEDYKKWFEENIPSGTEPRPDRKSGTGRNSAHIRAALAGASIQIPITGGKLQIGTWQEIIFFDFDDKTTRREFFIFVMGEAAAQK